MQLNRWIGLSVVTIAAAMGCAPESPDSHLASRREANVLAAPADEFLKIALEHSDSHDGGNENRFASAVALDGDTALIGSPCDAIGRNLCQGSVHVYVRSGNAWTFQAKLVLPDGLANERFGAAVSLQGNRALVGVPATNTAFVFVRSGESWTLEAELRASDGVSMDRFGTAVSLDGDRALIGAAQHAPHSQGVEGKGRAYVFVRSGQIWSEEAELVAADGAIMDNFGYAVSLSADTALIGAPQHSLLEGVGSAYVFVRSGSSWTEQGKLLGTGDLEGFFGTSVALDVDTAVVGASGCSDYCDVYGKAYVFSRAEAQWTRYVLGNTDWSFGTSVAVHGNEVLVGAPDSTATPPFGTAGAAFLFERSGQDWAQAAAIEGDPTEVLPTGAMHTPKFGSSVALSGDSTLVGADAVWSNGWVQRRYRGDAYVHVRSGATWERQRKFQLDYSYEGVFFGSAVASDADTAIVGAPAKAENWESFASDQPPGFARVYVRSGADWSPQANLAAPIDPIVPTNLFGTSIAVSGDTAIVGACCSNAESVARVFVRSGTTWTLQASLGDHGQSAGGHVALDGNTALVGGFVVPNTYQEMVYVFVRAGTTWTHQATLTTADSNSQFGSALALVGDLALVGAPGSVYQQPSGPYRGGSVHVFERSGESWTEQATLTRLDGGATEGKDDLFGASLAAVGDRALVGAPRVGKGGAAYVFRRSGSAWTREADLDAGDDPSFATFGCAVALSPDVAVVGRSGLVWGIAPSQGSAHVFARSDMTWTPRAVLTAPDGFVGDEFGAAVALVGDHAMIGAPNMPGDGIYGNPNEGAVYVMSLDGARGGAGGEGGAAGSGGDSGVTGGTGNTGGTTNGASGAGNGASGAENGASGAGNAASGAENGASGAENGNGGNGIGDGGSAEGGNASAGGTTSSDAGEPAAGTPSGGSGNPGDNESGCSCSTPGRSTSSPGALLILALAGFGVVRRRRRGSRWPTVGGDEHRDHSNAC